MPAPVALPTLAEPVRKERRAAEFRRLMVTDALTRAALARKLGVSRAWVTKVLGRVPRDET